MSKPLVSNSVQLVGDFSSYILLRVGERRVAFDHLEGVSGEETGIPATTFAIAGDGTEGETEGHNLVRQNICSQIIVPQFPVGILFRRITLVLLGSPVNHAVMILRGSIPPREIPSVREDLGISLFSIPLAPDMLFDMVVDFRVPVLADAEEFGDVIIVSKWIVG